MSCPDYLRLFHEHPERCLDPEAELRRYKAEEDTSEARAGRRDQRLQQRFAELEQRQVAQTSRWANARDILED